jgi:hypothetical protein
VVAALTTFADRPAAAEPASGHQDSTSDVPTDYFEHFTALLREGFAGNSTALKAAERHYQAARKLRPDDPRLEHAYALVLLKNFKHSEAVSQFRQISRTDPAYLPARRAIIRETIRVKGYAQALDDLVALADVVGKPQAPPAEQCETARWMGLALGFLSSPEVSENVRNRALTADAAIRQRLRKELEEHYDIGRQDVLVIEADLKVEEQTAEVSAKLIHQSRHEASAARRESYQARREALLETREQWDAWFADTTRNLDTQLDQLADTFDTLTGSATSLAESIQTTQLELMRLQTVTNLRAGRRGSGGDGSGRPPRVIITGAMLVRSQEYDRYVTQYWNVQAQRDRVARAAQGLLGQRTAAEQRYRRATGAVAQQADRVQQWDARLKKKMEEAVKEPPSSHRVKSVDNRSRSFSTYDTFDLDAEQQRLLHSYDKPVKNQGP